MSKILIGHFKLSAIFSKCKKYLPTSFSSNFGTSLLFLVASKPECVEAPDEPCFSNLSFSICSLASISFNLIFVPLLIYLVLIVILPFPFIFESLIVLIWLQYLIHLFQTELQYIFDNLLKHGMFDF